MAGDKNIIFDKKIYFDGRQYSVKLPAKLYRFIKYSKTDVIRIIVNNSDPVNPKVSLEYRKKHSKI